MKIRQLFEDAYKFKDGEVEYKLFLGRNSEIIEIEDKLKTAFPNITNINSNIGQFISVSFKIENNVTEEMVNELSDDFFKVAEKAYYMPGSIKRRLICYGVPNITINVDDINVQLSSTYTLKGIHKVIKSTKLVSLTRPEIITSGGLGLLRIKNIEFIYIDSMNIPKWLQIIKNHLKDKDILSCHEELVDNGFEEYAQL